MGPKYMSCLNYRFLECNSFTMPLNFAPAWRKLNQQLEGFAVTCNFIKLKKKCCLSTKWKFTRGLECYIEGVFKVDEQCLNIFY